MESFLDLKATQEALSLVEEVYQLCRLLPKEELYGLASQLKRSSSSIIANIAEGYGRYTYADKANKYVIARGECWEVVALLHVAVRVRLMTADDSKKGLLLAEQVGKLLSGLIASSRNRSSS